MQFSELGGLGNIKPGIPVALDPGGYYVVVQKTDGSLRIRANSAEIIKVPKSQASTAMLIMEVTTKIGELDMMRSLTPLLKTIESSGLLSHSQTEISRNEELVLMKKLVSIYGIEGVQTDSLDPDEVAKSIRLNTGKRDNSFWHRGKEHGILTAE